MRGFSDSTFGTLFGFGALADWKFLGVTLAFPAAALIVVLFVRLRERRRAKRNPPA
jgi:hypothetical protein